MRCAAVIVAAGSSRRMGFDKLAAEIRGVSVLRRSVDAFMATPEVTRVIVVAPEERFAALGSDFPKPLLRVMEGRSGRTRSRTACPSSWRNSWPFTMVRALW